MPRAARAGRGPGGGTSRERLVQLAIELADSGGIDAVSVRTVAHRAGVSTDQVYRNMRNRDDLLAMMVERVLADGYKRSSGSSELADPRDHLERLARDEWALYRRHPWLLAVLATTRPPASPAVLAMVDRAVVTLARAGYGPDEAFAAYLAVSGYVQGMALLHVAEQAERNAGATAWTNYLSSAHAHLEEIGRAQDRTWLTAAHRRYRDADAAVDGWFEFGLVRLLDGLFHPGRIGLGKPA
jgi:AcrR family transcriptional regulator